MVGILARRFLFFLALILLFAWVAAGQAPKSGILTGTVTDQQGGIIPRAAILAKNNQTESEFRALTNEIGVWVVHSVPSGSYTVTVTAQGFLTTKVEEIKVDIETTIAVDTTLQIGLADTVLVTASKYEEDVLNAPATASVISEQMIRDSPSQNLAELLRAVPGMNVAQISVRQFGVTSRTASGLMPGTQLALIDGRTIYQDYGGAIYWDFVPTSLDEVKQVEVIRGPGSAVWGANAMNGVVHVITKPPREMIGTSFTLGIGTFDRSDGSADSNTGSIYYAHATRAQALNDRWSFKITGGAYTQDAFARPEGTIPNPYHTPYPSFKNEGTTQPKVDARADYDLPEGKQHFTFAGGYVSSEGITNSPIGPFRLSHGMTGHGKADYVRGALRITGYVNLIDFDSETLLLVDPTGQSILFSGKTQTYHLEFGDSRVVQKKHLISYGGSFRHNEFNVSLTPGGESRDEGGAYFQDEIVLSEHFRWIVGARLDKFDILKGVVFSPRTTFMLRPVLGQTIRVSYNRAYVAPSMFMNYLMVSFMNQIDLGLIDPQFAGNCFSFPVRAVGNKDLEEQSLSAYEVGHTAVVAKGRASIGAAFYINDSKGDFGILQADSYTSRNQPPGWPLPPSVLDAMVAAGVGLPSLITYQNLGKVRNKGLELSADVRLNRYVNALTNYSWQARPDPQDFDLSLLNLPPTHRFNAGMGFDYRRYLGNVSVVYVSSAYWNDIISPLYSGPTAAYTTVNATAGIRWGAGKYAAMLRVANLFNTSIQNHVWGDILKRQIVGELMVRF